jgi:hypothetical protein
VPYRPTGLLSMAHDEEALRPETLALDALIKATVAKVREQGDPSLPDAMLFMGNWHQAVPALVIQDPVLEPVDKLVWMVIMLHARETGGRTAFPDYDTIATKTNVASTSTISRAIAILRLTRWLTLCARVRQTSGRFTGNVYSLHDEPLPLADALFLDAGYMAFVTQAQNHHHARVQRVAQAVLASMDQTIQAGDLGRQESPIERRIQAAQHLSGSSRNQHKGGRYFTFHATSLDQLKKPVDSRVAERASQHQNSKAEAEEHYSSRCSSDYKKTTTTTTTTNTHDDKKGFSQSSSSGSPPTEQALIYPPRLSDNQKRLADRYLAMINPEDRQLVLDELQGRLSSEQKGMKPVYDELRFLHSLCKAAQKGEFVLNLGIKVVEARQQRASHGRPPEGPAQKAKTAEERARSRAYGREQLAKLRDLLNMDK